MNKIKLEIYANKATMTPPVGPILGQFGIDGKKFCQEFNDSTKHFKKDTILRVTMNQLANKTIINKSIQPSIIKIIRKLAINSIIDIRRIYQLALIISKIQEKNNDLQGICKTLISIAHSMHFFVFKG